MKFESMKIIDTIALRELYNSVEWYAYTKNEVKMAQLLPNSLYWYAAYDENRLVGLIRVVGDGVSIVYIQDILVDPKYQGKKVGTQLIHHVMDKYKNVRQLVLLTDSEEKTLGFYNSVGLVPVQNTNASALIRYNFNA